MNIDWKALATDLCTKIENDGPDVCFEPTFLELLVDMQDVAPAQAAQVLESLGKAKRLTAIRQQMKRFPFKPPPSEDEVERNPSIHLEYDRMSVINQIIQFLVVVSGIFVQASTLVRLVIQKNRMPVVSRYERASLSALISSVVTLYKREQVSSRIIIVPIQPDPTLVEGILQHKDYPGANNLRGITAAPIIHKNGTVSSFGYDGETQFFCAYKGDPILLPASPTREDAVHALSKLTEMVSDFPFKEPFHRSAWLAGLLTLLMRPTFQGPSPLFLWDGNAPGSGKTKLADLISIIVLGIAMPRQPFTEEERELNATITSVLAEGSLAVLFDNVACAFGGAMLDLVLTGDRVRVRLYGHNDTTLDLVALTVFFVTGNNITLRGDLARRVVVARLESPEERPENRSGFKFPNLLQTALERRTELLTAACTLVRAFILAGRPSSIAPLGSFEGWSSWVRDLLLWLGEPDPVLSQESLREERDAPLIALLEAWVQLWGGDRPHTIYEALEEIQLAERALRRGDPITPNSREGIETGVSEATTDRTYAALRLKGALKDLGLMSAENASAVALGKRFKQFANRVCKGRMFVCVSHNHSNAWKVVQASAAKANGGEK